MHDVADVTLACRDCGTDFIFTAGEQRFFTERGFKTPSRCKACRNLKKARQDTAPVEVGPGFAGYPTPPSSDRGRRQSRTSRRDRYED
jgi:hypothetical protein